MYHNGLGTAIAPVPSFEEPVRPLLEFIFTADFWLGGVIVVLFWAVIEIFESARPVIPVSQETEARLFQV